MNQAEQRFFITDVIRAWMRWMPDGGEFVPTEVILSASRDPTLSTFRAAQRPQAESAARPAPTRAQLDAVSDTEVRAMIVLHRRMTAALNALRHAVRRRCAGADADVFAVNWQWTRDDSVVYDHPEFWDLALAMHAFMDAVDWARGRRDR